MNCLNEVQAQVNLAKLSPETAKLLYWFFLHDKEFVSMTINDGNVDLKKFPVSKVRQLAKRMENSKATAHHIKHMACDPQAVKINLMRHRTLFRKTQEEKTICQAKTT